MKIKKLLLFLSLSASVPSILSSCGGKCDGLDPVMAPPVSFMIRDGQGTNLICELPGCRYVFDSLRIEPAVNARMGSNMGTDTLVQFGSEFLGQNDQFMVWLDSSDCDTLEVFSTRIPAEGCASAYNRVDSFAYNGRGFKGPYLTKY